MLISSRVLRGDQAAATARLHVAKNGGACCRALQDVDQVPTMQQVLCLVDVIYVEQYMSYYSRCKYSTAAHSDSDHRYICTQISLA